MLDFPCRYGTLPDMTRLAVRLAVPAVVTAVSVALSWSAWSAGRIPAFDAVFLAVAGAAVGAMFVSGVRDRTVL